MCYKQTKNSSMHLRCEQRQKKKYSITLNLAIRTRRSTLQRKKKSETTFSKDVLKTFTIDFLPLAASSKSLRQRKKRKKTQRAS